MPRSSATSRSKSPSSKGDLWLRQEGAGAVEPDRFDVDRDTRGHVGFGFGIHFCLGASLARLEARVGFEELFKRVSKLQRLDPEVEYVDSFLLRGPRQLRLAADRV